MLLLAVIGLVGATDENRFLEHASDISDTTDGVFEGITD